MKYLDSYKQFESNQEVNESWRQVRAWLKLPQILLERLIGVITGYIPQIGFKYDKLAGKIDIGQGLSPMTIKDDPKKLSLDDIKNNKLKNSLKVSGILNKWNVYYMRTIEGSTNNDSNNRDVIYVTKDELKKGDKVYAERLDDRKLNKDISDRRKRKERQRKGIQISDIEPQLFVVAALETNEQGELKDEQKERYARKRRKELEKKVNDKIKRSDVLGRIQDGFRYIPIVFKVVEEDRVDLMKKLIDGAYDDKEVKSLLTMVIDGEGSRVPEKRWSEHKELIDEVKSDEMRDLITDTLNSLDV